MNSYIEFFEQIIGFDKYIEIRIFGLKKIGDNEIPILKFAKDINELLFLTTKYKDYNLYVSVNPRNSFGGKSSNTTFRRNIIFDIETKSRPKPMLTDEVYFNKLKATVNYVCSYMKSEYNLNPNAIVKSGRGMHLYFSIEPLYNNNQSDYERWYMNLLNHINNNSPYHSEIECDSAVKDLSRILGCPGTINVKYPEKPIREILYINRNINKSILNILDDFKQHNKYIEKKTTKRGIHNCNNKTRYTNDTILTAPEFDIWRYKPMSGTNLNNKLRLAGKLLIDRDNITNTDEISKFISQQGYPYKDMHFDRQNYNGYEYSEALLNSYVLENYDWATKVGYKIPYMLSEELKLPQCKRTDINEEFIDNLNTKIKINGYQDFVNIIKMFNNKYCQRKNNEIIYYPMSLYNSINKYYSNNTFKVFVEQNNLFNRLKYLL